MEYEKTLLGQMLSDNRIAIDVSLTGDEFRTTEHKSIFKGIKACIDEGINADITTVPFKVKNVNPHNIAVLTNNIPTAANWKFYQEEIKKAHIKRRLLYLADSIKQEITDHDPASIIEQIENELTDITKGFADNNRHTFKNSMKGFVEVLEKRLELKGEIPGIPTGLNQLDKYILGFQKKFLYYIGARPSGGKSAMVLNMALHAMLRENKIIGYISAESSLNEILTRSFAQEGHINSIDLLKGNYTKKTYSEFGTLLEVFDSSNGHICDEPNMSLQALKREARRMVRIDHCDILFVDYVQLITNKDFEFVKDRVAETSMALKMLARELDIPIVVAAQLRRDSEHKRPTMADFSESSQIEKDADVAMMIYHQDDKSWLLIEKARDGKTGEIPVVFKKEYVRFYEKEWTYEGD